MRTIKIDTSKLDLLPVPEGTSIRIKHINDPRDLRKLSLTALSGGVLPPPAYATRATLYDKVTGEELWHEYSYCSHKDVPCKKLGRIIAWNRCVRRYKRKDSENPQLDRGKSEA